MSSMQVRTVPGGCGLRPKPTVFQDAKNGITVLMSTWGSRDIESKLFEQIRGELTTSDNPQASEDPDVTQIRAGAQASGFASSASVLQFKTPEQALRGAHQWLLVNENQKRWRTAVEVLVLRHLPGQMQWAHTSGMQLYVRRDNWQMVSALHVQSHGLVLPFGALGLEFGPALASGNFLSSAPLAILCVAAPRVSPLLLQTGSADLQDIVDLQVSYEPDCPQWFGLAAINS